MDLELFIAEVKEDLAAQIDIGVHVPDGAMGYANQLTEDELGMSITDAADMCIGLAL
jgi:hypothetical protein